MLPNHYAECTCPKCGYRKPLTYRQYEAMFTQVWECPGCDSVNEIMKTARCV